MNIISRRILVALASSCDITFYSGQYSPIFLQLPYKILDKSCFIHHHCLVYGTNLDVQKMRTKVQILWFYFFQEIVILIVKILIILSQNVNIHFQMIHFNIVELVTCYEMTAYRRVGLNFLRF